MSEDQVYMGYPGQVSSVHVSMEYIQTWDDQPLSDAPYQSRLFTSMGRKSFNMIANLCHTIGLVAIWSPEARYKVEVFGRPRALTYFGLVHKTALEHYRRTDYLFDEYGAERAKGHPGPYDENLMHFVVNQNPGFRIWPSDPDWSTSGADLQVRREVDERFIGGCLEYRPLAKPEYWYDPYGNRAFKWYSVRWSCGSQTGRVKLCVPSRSHARDFTVMRLEIDHNRYEVLGATINVSEIKF